MLKKMISNNKAFTFMESMVVIIMIGILVVIWGFHGRDHAKLAMMSEARMFVDKIIAQEKMYYANNGVFIASKGVDGLGADVESVDKLVPIFIDTKSNKYFKAFMVKLPDINTVVVELYPDVSKYPDMSDFYIRAVYATQTDAIEYDEFYGSDD